MRRFSRTSRRIRSPRLIVVAMGLVLALGAAGCGSNSFTGSGTMRSGGGYESMPLAQTSLAQPVATLNVTSFASGLLSAKLIGAYSDTGIPASYFGQPVNFTMSPGLTPGLSDAAQVQSVADRPRAAAALAAADEDTCVSGFGPYRPKQQAWIPSNIGIAVVLACPDTAGFPTDLKVGATYEQTWTFVIAAVGGAFSGYLNVGELDGKMRVIR